MQAPERGPRAPEGRDLGWAAPLLVSGSEGGGSPWTAASAGVWSLSLVVLDLVKDSRLKRES